MATFTKPYTFTAHTKAKAAEVNSDFDTIYNGLNNWPNNEQFVGLKTYVPFVFHRLQELYVNSQLFPTFCINTAEFWELPLLYDLTFIHQGNTTKGTTTILLKRKRSGVDTTVATLTIPTLTAPNTRVTASGTDTPVDGDIYYLDVTAVGAVPPASVTIYTTYAVGSGG